MYSWCTSLDHSLSNPTIHSVLLQPPEVLLASEGKCPQLSRSFYETVCSGLRRNRTTGRNLRRSFPIRRVLTVRLDTFSVVGETKGALLAFLRSSESSCCRLSLARPLRVVQPGFLDRSQWTGMKMHSCSYDGEETGNKQERVVCI